MAPKRLPEYLEPGEALALLDAPYKTTGRQHRLQIWLGLSALRASEVCNLRVRDLSFVDLFCRVRGGKGDKDRTCYLSSRLCIELSEYIRDLQLEPEALLFDMKPGSLWAMVRRYAERAGIKKRVDFHILRHTWAVQSLKAKRSLRSIQLQLGHSSLTTTAIYLRLVPEDLVVDCEKNPVGW